jgi:hypothetical protein
MVRFVVAVVRRFWPNCVGIGIFGSVARGTTNENSDIDLLIVLNSGTPVFRGLYTVWDETVSRELPTGDWAPHFVECLSSEKDPGSLWLEFAHHGKILWSSDSFDCALETVRSNIAAGIYYRRKEPGTPFYWVKK